MTITQVLLARIVFQLKVTEERRRQQTVSIPLDSPWDMSVKEVTPVTLESSLHICLNNNGPKRPLYSSNSPVKPIAGTPESALSHSKHPFAQLQSNPPSPSTQKEGFEHLADDSDCEGNGYDPRLRDGAHADAGLRPVSDEWSPPNTWKTSVKSLYLCKLAEARFSSVIPDPKRVSAPSVLSHSSSFLRSESPSSQKQ